VLVFANGGRALWDAFVEDLRRDPRGLEREQHPLDAFIARSLRAVDPDPAPGRRWIRCAAGEPNPADFRTLAVAAGLGTPSMLGLVMHETYGLWLGLRAACFTVEALPTSRPPPESACLRCPAPCVVACPAGAIDQAKVGTGRPGWKVDVCAQWNVQTTDCASTCVARDVCPEGMGHRYSALQRQYHYDRATGRRLLASHLGISDEMQGVGPHWDDWVGADERQEPPA
jgi:hypothetical protein